MIAPWSRKRISTQLFNAPLPDSREMCHSQGKAFVCVGDGEPEHIRIELPDGTIERKRIASGSTRRILPEGWIEQVASRALSHSPGHSPDLIRPERSLDAGGDRRQRRRQEHLVQALFLCLCRIRSSMRTISPRSWAATTIRVISAARAKSSTAESKTAWPLAGRLVWRPGIPAAAGHGSSRGRRRKDYEVQGLFIGTVSVEINMARVNCRVAAQTGHSVPDSEIRRRWKASQDNLVRTANSFIRVRLLDNSWGRWIENGELGGCGALAGGSGEVDSALTRHCSRYGRQHCRPRRISQMDGGAEEGGSRKSRVLSEHCAPGRRIDSTDVDARSEDYVITIRNNRRRVGLIWLFLVLLLLGNPLHSEEVWRGLTVTLEARCSPYDPDDYPYLAVR